MSHAKDQSYRDTKIRQPRGSISDETNNLKSEISPLIRAPKLSQTTMSLNL